MEKTELAKQFSLRLKEAMLAANLSSTRSTSGVCIHKLAEMTGYSLQICRRYLSGQAMPEAPKLMELAIHLGVTPGWLLFGDNPQQGSGLDDNIVISKNILSYIFSNAANLYQKSPKSDEVSSFLVKLIEDVSQIATRNEDESKKIIDLTFGSAKYFS
jgi:transcriptional regulator with XRE-family HTH domain